MSKQRARRRAERETERALAAERRARQRTRARRRRDAVARVRALRPSWTRWTGPGGRVSERRRAQNGLVAVVFVSVQVLAWLLSADWTVRAAVLVLSVLCVPVLVTLIFDRRS